MRTACAPSWAPHRFPDAGHSVTWITVRADAWPGELQDTGTFDARTREAIGLAVAVVDDCASCQAAHTAGGRRPA